MKNIYLIGIMGSGKSTIGRLLAKETNKTMVDTDAMVEAEAQKSIMQLFDQDGEPYFRTLESMALYRLSLQKDLIVSCGGGIVLLKPNIELMKASGIIVYIKRSVESIEKNITAVKRPLLKNRRLGEIFEQRKDLYATTCDIEILNERSPKDAVRQIMAALKL
jgi:shikimate kinase